MSWRVTPSQRGTRRRAEGGMWFLNPGGGTRKRGQIRAPHLACAPTAPPAPPRRPTDAPWTQRPGARPAEAAAWPGDSVPGRARLGQASSSQNCPHPLKIKAPSALISLCTFPIDACSEARPAGGPAQHGPGGPRATKARPAAPAPRLPFQFSPDLRWN